MKKRISVKLIKSKTDKSILNKLTFLNSHITPATALAIGIVLFLLQGLITLISLIFIFVGIVGLFRNLYKNKILHKVIRKS